jgi:N-acetylglucosaminyldiphosphoundecaprenol N-acetyl-beta-D-mannosaminyltransferase
VARQNLMGMPLDGLTREQAVRRVVDGLTQGRGGAVLTPNLDVLRQYRHTPELRQELRSTELLVADGVPLVWASRIQGTPVPERITGSDMLESVTAAVAEMGSLVFLAGGRPDVPERAAQQLERAHPGVRTAAHPCFVGPGPLDPQIEELADAIVSARPEVVLVGLPFTAQVHVIAALRPRLPATWFVGVGSCFDFINGERRRAPIWLQRIGLEWAHRVVHEPRVWRRYFVQGLPFAARLGLHALRVRVSGGPAPPA